MPYRLEAMGESRGAVAMASKGGLRQTPFASSGVSESAAGPGMRIPLRISRKRVKFFVPERWPSG